MIQVVVISRCLRSFLICQLHFRFRFFLSFFYAYTWGLLGGVASGQKIVKRGTFGTLELGAGDFADSAGLLVLGLKVGPFSLRNWHEWVMSGLFFSRSSRYLDAVCSRTRATRSCPLLAHSTAWRSVLVHHRRDCPFPACSIGLSQRPCTSYRWTLYIRLVSRACTWPDMIQKFHI